MGLLDGLAESDGVVKKAVKPVLIFWLAIHFGIRRTRWQNNLDHIN